MNTTTMMMVNPYACEKHSKAIGLDLFISMLFNEVFQLLPFIELHMRWEELECVERNGMIPH
jgi:hypothetical protein